MSTWAVIVAAGSGDRLGADRPKAFARLGGRPLLAESLERLDASDWVDAIVVVVPEGWEEPAILLAEELSAGKVAAGRDRRREPCRVGAPGPGGGAGRGGGGARPRRGPPVLAARGDRARAGAARRGLGGGRAGARRRRHDQASGTRSGHRDARARRARRSTDAAGVRGGRAAGRAGRRHRLGVRLCRRSSRRAAGA